MIVRTVLARGAVAAIAVGALLAGCASIPTSGPVGVQQIDPDGGGGELVTPATGPQKGDTPQQILAGFLTAQTSPKVDGYSVAREFLTSELRSTWSPTELVRVSNTSISPELSDDGFARASVRILAQVNATGVYSEFADPQTETLDYAFAQDADGEWRISSAPKGSILPVNRFRESFSEYPLYFFDPSGSFLVPDVRWFPDTATRAERVVTELLAGQSPWYQGGVLVNAFPSGTQLGKGRVVIASGQASVDLSNEVAAPGPSDRWRMQQQLVATLSLSDVSSVLMTVGGFPVDVGDGAIPDWVLSVAANPLGLSDAGFGYLGGGGVDAVPGISPAVEGLGPLAVTLGRGRDTAAVRSAEGAWIVAAGDDPVLVDDREGLVDPGLDGNSFVWSAVAADAQSIIAVDRSGEVHPMPTPYLDGSIVSLEVSRDGARLLIGTQGTAGPTLTVVGIVRDGSGVPVSLGTTPLPVAIGSGRLLDAAWVDASTIATLSGDGAATQVTLYRIGGTHEGIGSVTRGVQLAGGNGVEGIRVRDADGTLWRPNSSGGWQTTSIVASLLATQQ
ncbi:LpqB family beta-propeller domain-containing protein [Protaetiibacter larvae]|uniref:GerMN domain-containing protein n=1 Tax=Protaetiibacter larvae TaxID=2592654 RepID=A0A5C1Y6J7_9MICO|nr:LpqB family beta-propeller domain-containing protein [Protaetiibacter larvae]QEO08582.1 hypothetical protein FLP23_00185 [Protaetiibacter larvae]